MKKIVIIIAAVLLIVSCSKKYGIETSLQPVPRSDIEIKKEGCAVIRSDCCDIYLEEIDSEKWKILLGNTIYLDNDSGKTFRFPKLLFFHAIIKNTADIPIAIEEIVLNYADSAAKSLDLARLRPHVKSPMYDIFNFSALLSPRRLLEEKSCLGKIKHDTETIGYEFGFIQPSDSIVRIIAFERPPIELRTMKLVFVITLAGRKKIVDFDLVRTEYRTTGDFTKPKKDKHRDDED